MNQVPTRVKRFEEILGGGGGECLEVQAQPFGQSSGMDRCWRKRMVYGLSELAYKFWARSWKVGTFGGTIITLFVGSCGTASCWGEGTDVSNELGWHSIMGLSVNAARSTEAE